MMRGRRDVLAESHSDLTMSVRRMLFNPVDVLEALKEIYKLCRAC